MVNLVIVLYDRLYHLLVGHDVGKFVLLGVCERDIVDLAPLLLCHTEPVNYKKIIGALEIESLGFQELQMRKNTQV